MKRVVIGIPYSTQTTSTNFETSGHCCEVLTASTLNVEALDLRSHANQVKEVQETGQERRLYREEGV